MIHTMKTSPTFVDRLDDIAPTVSALVSSLPDEVLTWVSANRDFGEDERYREKGSVDDTLTSNEVVTAERVRIENAFDGRASHLHEVSRYLRMLSAVHENVHGLLLEVASGGAAWTPAQHAGFWARFAVVADVDNAHAMYLSSGNWTFSVFNNLIDDLAEWAASEPGALPDILTGGICDVRTAIYNVFGDRYSGMNRADFIAEVRANEDWVRPEGYVTPVCFTPATHHRGHVSVDATEIAERFDEAVERVAALNPSAPVTEVADLYRRLYDVRRRYDIYEYFGAYAFMRNLAIYYMSEPEQAAGSLRDAQYLATTYQYEFAAELLERNQQ